jgi:pimeloyl-ACP methyl ester carboxylesterase
MQQTLQPCRVPQVEGESLCGSYAVFEDRATRSGRTIDIDVIVLRAFDESPAPDPVVFVAGGPGQSSTSLAPWIGRHCSEVRRRRDLVFIDQRGTGKSHTLACADALPRGANSQFGSLFPTDHIEACRKRLSARANLALYTTAVTVDDMDEIREWMGYEQINLRGGSYGTVVAQAYMRRYPSRVRTAVLAGVDPINRIPYLEGALNLQAGLEKLIRECEADDACDRSFPDFGDQFESLVALFQAGPVEVDMPSATGGRERAAFAQGDFAYAVRGMLYGRLASRLPSMVERAYRTGDLTPFAEYYLRRAGWVASEDIATGLHLSVFCSEDIPYTNEREVQAVTVGTFMGDYLFRQYANACDGWPRGSVPEGFHEPVKSSVPTLLLSGERDPVTPPKWGAEVARNLSNSLHVVVPNAGHGAGNRCTAALEFQLIEEGSVENLDPSCVAGSSRSTFLVR